MNNGIWYETIKKILFRAILFFLWIVMGGICIFAFSQEAKAVEPFCPGGTNPDSRVIFCEDWDSEPAPTNGFPNTGGACWHGWCEGGYNENHEGYASLDTTVKHSGTRSLMKRKNPRQSAVPDLIRDFTPTTQFRIRFYIYLAADWSTYDLNNTGEDGMHFLFLQTALSYRGVRMDLASFTDKTGSTPIPNLVYPWPPTCYNDTHPKAFFHIASPSGYGGTAKGVTRGRTDLCFDFHESANMQRWVLVEFAYRINSVNDGRASLWIDGIQRMADELIPPDPAYMNIGRIILSGYNSYPLPYSHTFYVDDIVVANDYNFAIGPTGGGTIRPRPMPPK